MAKSEAGAALFAQISAAFADFGLRELVVPEWRDEDGLPASIWVRPFTIEDRVRIETALAALEERKYSDAEFFLRVVVAMACDADGERLWDARDLPALRRRAMAETIVRLAQQAMAVPSFASAEKN